MLTRRGFLAGLLATPAIVHAGNLMPISARYLEDLPWRDIDFGNLTADEHRLLYLRINQAYQVMRNALVEKLYGCPQEFFL